MQRPLLRRTLTLRFIALLPLALVTGTSSETLQRARHVRFTTHEGSWLSFDVSRDARWIVMDLLGQLWLLPAAGGVASAITDVVRDTAEFVDPSYAPDGASILVHGEFRGLPGTYRVNVRNGVAERLTPDARRGGTGIGLNSGSWSPDGRAIVLTRRDSLIERELATGAERRIVATGLPAGELDSPTYSPDGRDIYFNSIVRTIPSFPPSGRIWRIPAVGGAAQPVSPAGLNALAAAPSPDGRRITYLVMDSASRAQVWMQGVLDSTAVQLTNDRDVTATRVRWIAGSDALVYAESGRLWRLDIATRGRREIPFSATVNFVRHEPKLAPVRFPSAGEEVAARGHAGFALSADGRSLATIALSRLWVAAVEPGAVAHEVAMVSPEAALPSWSPDGRHIAWASTPRDEEDLYVTDVAARTTRKLTSLPGLEVRPSWSPDGRRILFTHIGRDTAGRPALTIRVAEVGDSSVRSLNQTRLLGSLGAPYTEGTPQWSPRGDIVLVVLRPGSQPMRGAVLRFLDGSPERRVAGLPSDASWIRWLPGDTLVFIRDLQVWRAPLDVATGAVAGATRVTDEPAIELAASLNGDVVFRSDDGFRVRSRAGAVRIGFPVRYRVPTPGPLVVRNVRVIDGSGAGATSPRDLLVERGRISRIAGAGSLAAPAGVDVLDAGGRTAIPGLIDLHSHHGTAPQFRGQLYYGVTTLRSAGAAPMADNVLSGAWLGSRVTASRLQVNPGESMTGLYYEWNAPIPPGSNRDYLDRLMRFAADSGSQLVKLHTYVDFAGHVRAIAGAHARGTRVAGHCGYPLAVVAAGIDSKEHLGWQCSVHDAGTWYDDLVQLHARARLPVVPTQSMFLNTHRLRGAPAPVPADVMGLFGDQERAQVARSLTFLSVINAANARDLDHQVDALRKLHGAGVPIGTGTDFERPDGIQYELEALVDAGMTPLAAISSATSVAARIMGADADLGRIAPGLIADLVLLDADPTTEIRNVRKVWAVVQGGRVVDRRALVAPGWNRVPLSP